MHCHRASRLRVILIGAAASVVSAFHGLDAASRGTDLVAVHSTARPDYAARKFVEGGPTPETYVFGRGRFFGGGTRDASIRDTSFDLVVHTLAQDLVRQNYYPVKDPAAADQLLMVHWGTSIVPEELNNLIEDMMERMRYNAEEDDPDDADLAVIRKGEEDFLLLLQDTEGMSNASSIEYNAQLLGYSDSLNKLRSRLSAAGVSSHEYSMKQQLLQERYFIIVMAYDFKVLRDQKEKRLLWSTRFSMRSPGKNFLEALPAMSRVAGDFFGREKRDITTRRTHLGAGRVDMSEIEVIEIESPPEPRAPRPADRD